MCWNKEISLSTFIFGCAAIAIGYITKQHNFKWVLFYLTITSMQLIEFLIWAYGLNNNDLNKLFSFLGLCVVMLQPLMAGLLIQNNKFQLIYYIVYFLFVIAYFSVLNPIKYESIVAKNGHLHWKWLDNIPIWIIVSWTVLIFIAIYLSDLPRVNVIFICVFVTTFTAVSYYYYNKDGTFGSVYCSFINIMFVVILAKAFYGEYSCHKQVK